MWCRRPACKPRIDRQDACPTQRIGTLLMQKSIISRHSMQSQGSRRQPWQYCAQSLFAAPVRERSLDPFDFAQGMLRSAPLRITHSSGFPECSSAESGYASAIRRPSASHQDRLKAGLQTPPKGAVAESPVTHAQVRTWAWHPGFSFVCRGATLKLLLERAFRNRDYMRHEDARGPRHGAGSICSTRRWWSRCQRTRMRSPIFVLWICRPTSGSGPPPSWGMPPRQSGM